MKLSDLIAYTDNMTRARAIQYLKEYVLMEPNLIVVPDRREGQNRSRYWLDLKKERRRIG